MSAEIRVLIAEDSDDIRTMLKLRLNLDGRFSVVGEATDGLEAVELTKQLLPDLVLLDLGMPGMDGFEALPQIRSAHPDVKVSIISGFPAEKVERQALALGADLFVEKNDSLSGLADRLHSIVAIHHPGGTNPI